MATKKCPDCGRNFIGDVCPTCHPELVEAEQLPPGAKDPKAKKIPCMKCGKRLTEDQLFCPECGTQKVIPEIAPPVFCENCGTILEPKQKYCHKCGTPSPEQQKRIENHEVPEKRWPIIVAIVLVVAAIAGYIIFGVLPSRKTANFSKQRLEEFEKLHSVAEEKWEEINGSDLTTQNTVIAFRKGNIEVSNLEEHIVSYQMDIDSTMTNPPYGFIANYLIQETDIFEKYEPWLSVSASFNFDDGYIYTFVSHNTKDNITLARSNYKFPMNEFDESIVDHISDYEVFTTFSGNIGLNDTLARSMYARASQLVAKEALGKLAGEDVNLTILGIPTSDIGWK